MTTNGHNKITSIETQNDHNKIQNDYKETKKETTVIRIITKRQNIVTKTQ